MRSVAWDNQLKNPGLEKPLCSFYPLPHLLLPRSWPALPKPLPCPPMSIAKWCFYGVSKLPDAIFHQALKNTPAASTLCRTCFCRVPGPPVAPSLSSFPTRLTKAFTGLLVSVPLVKVTLTISGLLVLVRLPLLDMLAGLDFFFLGFRK